MHSFAISGFKRRACVVAAFVLTLIVVGVASASGTSFHGQVKSGGKLSFRTTATSVVGFKASVSALCVSVTSGASKLYVYPVLLQSPTPLKSGHFKIVFTGSSSTKITVTGSITGKSASGKITVRYTKTLGTTSTGLLDIGACSAKTTWTAKQG